MITGTLGGAIGGATSSKKTRHPELEGDRVGIALNAQLLMSPYRSSINPGDGY